MVYHMLDIYLKLDICRNQGCKICKNDQVLRLARDPELTDCAAVNHLRENFVRDGGVYGGAHRVGWPGSDRPTKPRVVFVR